MQKEEYQDTRETGPQAREYLPGVGRFMGRDLIKGLADFPFTLNEYGYCWNNPLILVDRNGALPEWLEDVKDWAYEHKEPLKWAFAGVTTVATIAATATISVAGIPIAVAIFWV